MTEITSLKTYASVIQSPTPVVVMFSSDACGDCFYADQFMHHIETLFNTYAFYRVKRETLPTLALDLKIYGVPSFLIYQSGTCLNRYVDKHRKSFEDVLSFIDQNLTRSVK